MQADGCLLAVNQSCTRVAFGPQHWGETQLTSQQALGLPCTTVIGEDERDSISYLRLKF